MSSSLPQVRGTLCTVGSSNGRESAQTHSWWTPCKLVGPSRTCPLHSNGFQAYRELSPERAARGRRRARSEPHALPKRTELPTELPSVPHLLRRPRSGRADSSASLQLALQPLLALDFGHLFSPQAVDALLSLIVCRVQRARLHQRLRGGGRVGTTQLMVRCFGRKTECSSVGGGQSKRVPSRSPRSHTMESGLPMFTHEYEFFIHALLRGRIPSSRNSLPIAPNSVELAYRLRCVNTHTHTHMRLRVKSHGTDLLESVLDPLYVPLCRRNPPLHSLSAVRSGGSPLVLLRRQCFRCKSNRCCGRR